MKASGDGHQRRGQASTVALIALLQFGSVGGGGNSGQVTLRQAALLADYGIGTEKDLHVGRGKDPGVNGAAFHDYAAGFPHNFHSDKKTAGLS